MAVRVLGGVLRRGVMGVGVSGGRLHTPIITPLLPVAASQCQPQRHYAMRLELTEHGIIWRRPEYVPSWNPEKSGDLSPHVEPAEDRVKVKLLPAKDLMGQVDDITKQLLSLKFGSDTEKLSVAKYDVLRDIQRHRYDTGSLEVTIAMLTVRIRKAQQELLTTTKGKRHTVRQRVTLNETIARRKKLLKYLRRKDYKRFEWLLHKLNILYRPPPKYYRFVTRKTSLRKLVKIHGQTLRRERLEKYKIQLEEDKIVFEKERIDTLRWIAETEADIGIPISVEIPEDNVVSSSSSSSS